MNRRNFLKYSISLGIAGVSSGLLRNYGLSDANASVLANGLSDPSMQPLFATNVTNALKKKFKFKADRYNGASHYKIKVNQTVQKTGLVNGAGHKLSTTVWGYGTSKYDTTWPGRTIEAQSNEQVKIKWKNRLKRWGQPLPHLLPVDDSLHWSYGLHGYQNVSIATDGVPVVPHVHGAHVDTQSDGNPEYFFGVTPQSRGPRWISNHYHYDNSQPAGMLWYHDHSLGITRLNVYAGLAGFYVIRDNQDTGKHSNPLKLPAKKYEHAYVVQDRMFKDNGELFFPAFPGDPGYAGFITGQGATPPAGKPTSLPEFFGDHIVVNGKIWPKKNVAPRHYRLRFLNGCDSRFMRLRFRSVPLGDTDLTNASAPLPFHLIGSDQGLLASAVTLTEIDFMPAERLDIVFDFGQAEDSRIIVENILGDGPFTGDLPNPDTATAIANGEIFANRQTDRIMAFDVIKAYGWRDDNFDPALFSSNYTTNTRPVDKVRKLALFEGKDEFGRLQPMLGTAEPTQDVEGNMVNGTLPWHSPITENPELDSTEIWEIYNATGDAHPMHVHLVHFDILDRAPYTKTVVQQPVMQHNGAVGIGFHLENVVVDTANRVPALPSEQGPKDMVIAYPGEVTRIKMTFDKAGRYVWHCHILSHEDHDMMRPMHIGPIDQQVPD